MKGYFWVNGNVWRIKAQKIYLNLCILIKKCNYGFNTIQGFSVSLFGIRGQHVTFFEDLEISNEVPRSSLRTALSRILKLKLDLYFNGQTVIWE